MPFFCDVSDLVCSISSIRYFVTMAAIIYSTYKSIIHLSIYDRRIYYFETSKEIELLPFCRQVSDLVRSILNIHYPVTLTAMTKVLIHRIYVTTT